MLTRKEPTAERRSEGREVPDAQRDWSVDVPGGLVLEVVNVSAHGLCCRLGVPVAPGRSGALRVHASRGRGAVRLTAHVVRCEVTHLGPDRVEYQAAWRLEQGWPGGA